jgi:hypothetical protein
VKSGGRLADLDGQASQKFLREPWTRIPPRVATPFSADARGSDGPICRAATIDLSPVPAVSSFRRLDDGIVARR